MSRRGPVAMDNASDAVTFSFVVYAPAEVVSTRADAHRVVADTANTMSATRWMKPPHSPPPPTVRRGDAAPVRGVARVKNQRTRVSVLAMRVRVVSERGTKVRRMEETCVVAAHLKGNDVTCAVRGDGSQSLCSFVPCDNMSERIWCVTNLRCLACVDRGMRSFRANDGGDLKSARAAMAVSEDIHEHLFHGAMVSTGSTRARHTPRKSISLL